MDTDKPYRDCDVNEEEFPRMGKCYLKNDVPFISLYEKICPYCDISSSLPYGESLKTVTIFECSKFSYGKRVSE